jgi:hypothetical protein
MKRARANCSNDAKSCYDLIGHTQAAISMQRVGVPRNIINCLFTTLQEAVHRVRTGFGDSKATYGGPVWLVPIHGIGQGNGAGPAIRAVVSTPLLNVWRKKGFRCELIQPLSSNFFKFVRYTFFDDMDIIKSVLMDNPASALQKLQQAIYTSEFSLKATCGTFVCNLYLFLGSNPAWVTRGLKQLVTYLAEVRKNRSLIHSVYFNQW